MNDKDVLPFLVDDLIDCDMVYVYDDGHVSPKTVDVEATLAVNESNDEFVTTMLELVDEVHKSNMKYIILVMIKKDDGDGKMRLMNRRELINQFKDIITKFGS